MSRLRDDFVKRRNVGVPLNQSADRPADGLDGKLIELPYRINDRAFILLFLRLSLARFRMWLRMRLARLRFFG